MDRLRKIDALFAQNGITQWGVAGFDDLLPLLPVKSARHLPRDPRSAIVFLVGYFAGEQEHNIARYAWVDDYHTVIPRLAEPVLKGLENLFPGHTFALFTDTGPVREVVAAHLAGLGFVGKNGLLINTAYGSCHFIAEIVTDANLPLSVPVQDGCGSCDACIKACPTNALGGDAFVKERCRSFITQKKGELTGEEQEQIKQGGLVWGCDVCTMACPHNNPPKPGHPVFTGGRLHPVLTEENMAKIYKQKAYGYRGKSVLQRNLGILHEQTAQASTERNVKK